jgi:bifunctional UDP-N-acetylglucosamine pyrophosphorylase/glucosamine-1-phosphate N-acetyltransferase
MTKLAVVILAAGEGTRMKSAWPKVLHQLAGRPLLNYITATVNKLQPQRKVVVLGHKYEQVLKVLPAGFDVAHQHEQLGTGHAVLQTEPLLKDFNGAVLVLPGDVPLVKSETLANLIKLYQSTKADCAVLTTVLENPFGYGRLARKANGEIVKIVEEKDATPEERKIKEVNAGIYAFNSRKLFNALKLITRQNQQKEYYLTDVIGIFVSQGEKVVALKTDNSAEVMGINSRLELAQAEQLVQEQLKQTLMAQGVTFIMPQTTYLTADVQIGADTTVYPYCFLTGKTTVGNRCQIGPAANIKDAEVGSEVKVMYAVIEGAKVQAGAVVGPYCYLRPGAKLKDKAKAGSFVEIKNSTVGENSKIPHLSYIGDAVIGKNVNIGAGSITCNYDGERKHRTIIEDNAFIGSDTMLIAPVKVGKGAVTGASSAITKDVPPESLAVERSEQKIVPGWKRKEGSNQKE